MATFSSGVKCFRSFLIRSLRYLNGGTLSPVPTEAGHRDRAREQIDVSVPESCSRRRNAARQSVPLPPPREQRPDVLNGTSPCLPAEYSISCKDLSRETVLFHRAISAPLLRVKGSIETT